MGAMLAILALLGCSPGVEPEAEEPQAANVQGSKPAGDSGGVYGAAWGANSLRNFEVGKLAGRSLGLRFRAGVGAAPRSARFYVKTGAGYSAGTGGELRIELRSDDGSATHMPSNTVLAWALLAQPGSGGWNQMVQFDDAPNLEAGVLYHLVFVNTAADPAANYVSINTLDNDGGEPMQPGVPNEDLSVNRVAQAGSAWTCVCDGATPIFALTYANGSSQGQGYIDVKKSGTLAIAGGSQVRQVFTVSSRDRMVSRVSIRLRRVDATEPLTVRLERNDGSAMEEGAIPAASVPLQHSWVTYEFSAPHRLQKGRTYRLLLQAPAQGRYEIFPLQEGSNYGFAVPGNFRDGRFQYTLDGRGWQDFQGGPVYDMQFYFTLVGP